MDSNNVEITTAQKDWDDFFAPENDPKTSFDSVDSDWLELYMVGEHGSGKKHKTNKPVDESPFNYQGPPPGYVFDR
jgi:hypothetical protein